MSKHLQQQSEAAADAQRARLESRARASAEYIETALEERLGAFEAERVAAAEETSRLKQALSKEVAAASELKVEIGRRSATSESELKEARARADGLELQLAAVSMEITKAGDALYGCGCAKRESEEETRTVLERVKRLVSACSKASLVIQSSNQSSNQRRNATVSNTQKSPREAPKALQAEAAKGWPPEGWQAEATRLGAQIHTANDVLVDYIGANDEEEAAVEASGAAEEAAEQVAVGYAQVPSAQLDPQQPALLSNVKRAVRRLRRSQEQLESVEGRLEGQLDSLRAMEAELAKGATAVGELQELKEMLLTDDGISDAKVKAARDEARRRRQSLVATALNTMASMRAHLIHALTGLREDAPKGGASLLHSHGMVVLGHGAAAAQAPRAESDAAHRAPGSNLRPDEIVVRLVLPETSTKAGWCPTGGGGASGASSSGRVTGKPRPGDGISMGVGTSFVASSVPSLPDVHAPSIKVHRSRPLPQLPRGSKQDAIRDDDALSRSKSTPTLRAPPNTPTGTMAADAARLQARLMAGIRTDPSKGPVKGGVVRSESVPPVRMMVMAPDAAESPSKSSPTEASLARQAATERRACASLETVIEGRGQRARVSDTWRDKMCE